MKPAFDKPPLSIPAQRELLSGRGLLVEDEAHVEHYLNFIGYFRLSGYLRFFVDPTDPANEKFVDGTKFQNALDLYVFDRKLRVLLLDALERIEISIKSTMNNVGATTEGAMWLSDAKNFDRGRHTEIETLILDCLGNDPAKNQHVFIASFCAKYSDPHPPCWMLMEALSFGAVSKIYKLMKGHLRQKVSQAFNLQHDVLENWLHVLSTARNVCAHHGRVWNRSFTIWPKIPKNYRGVWPAASQDKLYVLCAIIHHMMERIADGSRWSERLMQTIGDAPVDIGLMGFPKDWTEQTFWQRA
ncbi:Abi family protein [Bradyrhizobium elkanii]|uniref:Abi family protein n=1 Tax=Bradyrhizobium elkanii TaxID=29448 RepID=UPI0018AD3098|nr:Abi family protein [Bradyrhizobium elkanii]